MKRVRDHHDHGGLSVTPHTEIPPLHADVFGAQSSSFRIGTGTEGSIDYEGLGMGFTISWANPFIGENEIGASAPGGNLSPLRIVTTKGAGNEAAHMRYEIFPRSPTWSHSLPSAASSTKVATGTSPTSWYTTPENVQHIAYVGDDRKVHQCFFFVGGFGGWRHETHIAYVSASDQTIHESFFFIR